jgi:hypothetical protein
MNLKQLIVRTMMNGLPPEEQVLMVTDFLKWLFSDCSSAERGKKLAFWTPKLIEHISSGGYGLWLLIFHYMKYLVALRWLRTWFDPVKAPREDHITR